MNRSAKDWDHVRLPHYLFLNVSEGSFYLLESNEIAMGFEFFDVYDNYTDFEEEFGDEDFESVSEVKEWEY